MPISNTSTSSMDQGKTFSDKLDQYYHYPPIDCTVAAEKEIQKCYEK